MTEPHDDLDIYQPDSPGRIEVQCSCGCRFDVPISMKAGLANCPECRRATRVPGGPEPLFWWLLGGGVLFALLLSGFLGFALGLEAGFITLGGCAVLIVVWLMAS